MSRLLFLPLFGALAVSLFAQQPPAQPPGQTKAPEFFIHAFHKDKLGGTLDCSMCHVAEKAGSVTMKRPGHDQCMTCHSDAFDKAPNPKICSQCHTEYPPTGPDTLVPFPRYKGSRTILFEFSHKQHTDPKARIDARTGFRSDCTFCHKFDAKGQFASFPAHEQCATCHSKPGMKPQLTAELSADTCRGCHTPEEIENPGFTEARRFTGAHTTTTGKYVDIKFDHGPHFKAKEQFSLRCTTCHYAIPNSTSIANLSLPKMLDCVECHDSARAVKADFRMSKCSVCHANPTETTAVPLSHTVNVKPDFHTEAFRTQHAAESNAPDAKCFVCHQNVTPSVSAKTQCDNCHQVMLPKSHTARWKDDLHGKYAALDRTTCATCHTAAYCSDCHNELPRSHNPLPLFKAGGHAMPAKLDLRTCFTCHTFQNTCSECHVNSIAALQVPGLPVVAAVEPAQRGMPDLSPFLADTRADAK
jgi:hypothetical protein